MTPTKKDVDSTTSATEILRRLLDERGVEWGDVPYLPHFWTHDGVLHIEATRMPTRIVVREGGTCEFVPKRELDASESENAKLRELVRIAGTYCVNGLCGKDDGCPLYLGKPYCALLDRMRELGIEVDA